MFFWSGPGGGLPAIISCGYVWIVPCSWPPFGSVGLSSFSHPEKRQIININAAKNFMINPF